MDLDAELLNNILSNNTQVMFSNQGQDNEIQWCGASLGGAVDYIPNPTLRFKKRRVFTFGALAHSVLKGSRTYGGIQKRVRF